MANSCAVCGETLHSGRCIDVLRRALHLARGQSVDNRVDKSVDFDFVSHPVAVHMVSTSEPVDKLVSTDRKAYKREWMRRRRAQHA